ncbi:immunoglobulin superfamily member 1-like isoform X2 [Scyliorhinus canicula]|nr:immunoglobulin superfamily member 1-like isoform X2 [Scyliorhinus canicula]XP_038642984.1 immunoglobulin superfamily member 1-like isoform X2 [Scyliorhinus canicula]XP_038642985.1 immunoglobulin superfamily member 1-like isoform X2 [Scyliorhinus canicula]
MLVYCLKLIIHMAATSSLLVIVASFGVDSAGSLSPPPVDYGGPRSSPFRGRRRPAAPQSVGLPKPTLTLEPQSSIILPGENYSLSCHFPLTRCSVELYTHFKVRVMTKTDVNYTAVFRFSATQTSKGPGTYNCKYQKFFETNMTWAYSPISDPVQFSITDELPKPSVSIEPATGLVTVGDRVHINCTTSYPSQISHLYREHGGRSIDTHNVSDSMRTIIFTIKEVDPMDGGAYSCSVSKAVLGKTYESPRSNFVEFNVTDELPKPTISVEPATRVLTVGERVNINCTSSHRSHISNLYREQGQPTYSYNMSEFERSIIFTIKELTPQDAGAYSCSFVKAVKGAEYESPRSDIVTFNVTEKLPRATISVDPASGVVSRGKPIRLTCIGAILPSGGRFYFYRDDDKKGTLDVSGNFHAASFIVNDMVNTGKWNYTCGYARIVQQIAYHAPRSIAVEVTVAEFNGTSNTFPTRLCLSAILLLGIVLVLGME